MVQIIQEILKKIRIKYWNIAKKCSKLIFCAMNFQKLLEVLKISAFSQKILDFLVLFIFSDIKGFHKSRFSIIILGVVTLVKNSLSTPVSMPIILPWIFPVEMVLIKSLSFFQFFHQKGSPVSISRKFCLQKNYQNMSQQ